MLLLIHTLHQTLSALSAVRTEAERLYTGAYPTLKVHHPGYPSPDYIRGIVKWGNVEFEGDYSKDTEGSNLIKRVLLDEKPGPVFLQTWGGASTVAAALRSIEEFH